LHTIALYTYGMQVRNGVSCIKCTRNVPVILKTLFGDRAVDKSTYGTYQYIHIPGVHLKNNFLILRLTDEEKAEVERITAPSRHYPYTYLWRDNGWYEFPYAGKPTYRPAQGAGSTYPRLRGDNVAPLSPSENAPASSTAAIPHNLLDFAFEIAVRTDPDENARNADNGTHLQQPGDDDGLDLMPPWLAAQIAREPHRAANGERIVFAKYFLADGDYYFFVGDYNPRARDVLVYALLNGDLDMAEWGWQRLGDLQAMRGKFRLPLERDTSFRAKPLYDALAEFRRARGWEDEDAHVTSTELPSDAVRDLAPTGSDDVIPADTEISTRISSATHSPDNIPQAEALPTDHAETTLPAPEDTASVDESMMRSVRSEDVTAALIAHIHDSERDKPLLIDFVGARNAVKHLLAKAFSPSNVGTRDGAAFYITNGTYQSAFRLPDYSYKALQTALKTRSVEGRIVALDATTAAPREECYVLVADHIILPDGDVSDAWAEYVRYVNAPNRAEFARYTAPGWARDLYNVFGALRARLGRPLHISWMPWLFRAVTDVPLSSEALGMKYVTVCKYIAGYLDPRARGAVEGGAYRLTCGDKSDLWGEVILRNPDRMKGIDFGKECV
jgi:hypothetical protein